MIPQDELWCVAATGFDCNQKRTHFAFAVQAKSKAEALGKATLAFNRMCAEYTDRFVHVQKLEGAIISNPEDARIAPK